MKIIEGADFYMLLEDNRAFVFPKKEEQICFYDTSRKIEMSEDGTLVYSEQISLKQALKRIERAGVDDIDEVLDKLIRDGKCNVTMM